jgi:hypothetical protein
MVFLGEASASSREVIFSVREAIVYFPALRKSIIEKLLDSFYYIKDLDVLRATLWIMVTLNIPSVRHSSRLFSLYEKGRVLRRERDW